jgi:hypothetical protein
VSAIISPCGLYRYRLERDGSGNGATAIIMVNPSTADAGQDDATIRRLRGFGERGQWGRLIVGNLFAYRSTDVRKLAEAVDPIGPENYAHLNDIAAEAQRVVFAWGPVSKLPKRLRTRWRAVDAAFRALGHEPQSIGAPAKDGHPCFPTIVSFRRGVRRCDPSLPLHQGCLRWTINRMGVPRLKPGRALRLRPKPLARLRLRFRSLTRTRHSISPTAALGAPIT